MFLQWLADAGGDPKRLHLLTEIDLINYRQYLASGEETEDEDLARVSPLARQHVIPNSAVSERWNQ